MRKHLYVFIALMLMGSSALELNAQEKQTRDNLTDVFYSNKAQLKDLKVGNQYYVTLQFDQLPNRNDLAILKEEGIQLLSYQSNQTYQAILPATIKRATLETLGIRSIFRTPVANKLSRSIATLELPAYAVVETGSVDVAVIFHETADPTSISRLFQQYNVQVLKEKLRRGKTQVVRIDQDVIADFAASPIVAYVDVKAPAIEKLNYECRTNQKVNTLQSGIPGDRNLTGDRVVIGVGDGGELGDHIDFDDRVINKANGTYSSFGDHGDHVAGIIGGAGHINPRHKGIAPGSTIITQKTGSITYYAEDYINDYEMVLTNNSYGTSFNCDLNGTYNYTSQNLDWQMREFPELLHVFAAGNSGRKTCEPFPKGYNTVLRFYQSAKNVLTVGNVDQDGVIYKNSSRGPVADGRIKPEICGIGANVYSTGAEFNYKKKAGTSMSSPAVVGSLALLYEQYRNLNNNQNPPAALIKAIACNTADDLGNKGPDYIYGFGLMNTLRAVETIEAGNYISNDVSQDEIRHFNVEVPSGVNQLKVMLYWHDKEAEADALKALVNDLDITLTTPSGETYLPWGLDIDPLAVADLATRKVDTLNNIEQITIDLPTAGSYSINVTGSKVAIGPQDFHITYEMVQSEVNLTFPYGSELLQPNSIEYIQWQVESSNTRKFKLEYSLNDGDTWTLITDTIPSSARSYLWNVPTVATEQGKIRVTKVGLGQSDENETVFSILPVIDGFVAEAKCEGILEFNWNKTTLTDIEGYELCYYNGVEMEALVMTNDTSYTIEDPDFELGQMYWFSVRIKLASGEYTQRVSAESCIPQTFGLCPWEDDALLQQVYIKGTGRQMTSSQLTNNENVQISIFNVGTNSIGNIPISYQINNGTVVTETLVQSIQPGDSLVYEFEGTADLDEVGTYEIDAWINMNGDTHNSNDSLLELPTITQLPNAPITVTVDEPFTESFESVNRQIYSNSAMGLEGIIRWDYETNLEGDGQLELNSEKEFIKLYPTVKEIDETFEHSVIWTLNLSNYNPDDGDLVLSMSYLNDTIIPLTTVLPSENKVFVRGNDQDEWLDLYTMVLDGSKWQTVEDLNIYNRLLFAGQSPSTSTQIKFSQSDEFGFIIDDLELSLSATLPVNLVSFTAEKMNGDDVLLKWDTASEQNNDYFEVEVAIGEEAVRNNRFEVIGVVEGMGTTSELANYKFIDEMRNKRGSRYYRLKQYDFDGRFSYSPIRLVSFNQITDPIKVYPNPFYDYLRIDYTSDIDKTIDIHLVDTQGKILRSYQKSINTGHQEVVLDMDGGLASGVYFIRIADTNRVQTFRLTKIHH